MGILSRFGDNYLWEARTRPQTIDDIILPDRIRKRFGTPEKIFDVGHILLSGPRGTGKTTLAGCIADQSNRECLYINFSDKTSVDVIRDLVSNFIASVSFKDGKKIVLGDEFDRLSTEGQDCLKSTMEVHSNNFNLICISNHEVKLIPELRSRLRDIVFTFTKAETKQMKIDFWKRTQKFLKEEGVKFDKMAVAEVINKQFPDMRKTINTLHEIFITYDEITMENTQSIDFADLDTLFGIMKTKDYTSLRQYVMDQNIDLGIFYSLIYKDLDKYIKQESIVEAVAILGEWQYKANFSLDKQIPLMSSFIRIMNECELI